MSGIPLPVLPPVAEPAFLNDNYILYWNSIALDLNRITVTIGGPTGGPLAGPPGAARALGILHLAIHDAYFTVKPKPGVKTYLSQEPNAEPPLILPEYKGAHQPKQAVAGAAYTVLYRLYATDSPVIGTKVTLILRKFLQSAVAAIDSLDLLSESYQFGVNVAGALLKQLDIKPEDPGLSQGSYKPANAHYHFNDDPTNPVRLVPVDPNDPAGPQKAMHIYHAPFYGLTAKRLAVQHKLQGHDDPVYHVIADPPVGFGTVDVQDYKDSTIDVYRKGGAADLLSTTRTDAEMVTGFTWAFDGTALLGTPPRLYNRILRGIACEQRLDKTNIGSEANNADFARLFALCNVAAADAGIFAWQEKYRFDFWRPLSGLRAEGKPFWLTQGAPHTNSNDIAFKPPFPSYPSGHATFGGAFFQAARLHFKYTRQDDDPSFKFDIDKPDNIKFKFVSEELNGINRDLRAPYDPSQDIRNQPGTVRTRIERSFNSLWEAIFDNAVSRVYIGVHWPFDAFSSKDVATGQTAADGTTIYKDPKDISYKQMGARRDAPNYPGGFPVGGVPLGIQIANDIYQGGLQPTPKKYQPTGLHKAGDFIGPVVDPPVVVQPTLFDSTFEGHDPSAIVIGSITQAGSEGGMKQKVKAAESPQVVVTNGDHA